MVGSVNECAEALQDVGALRLITCVSWMPLTSWSSVGFAPIQDVRPYRQCRLNVEPADIMPPSTMDGILL